MKCPSCGKPASNLKEIVFGEKKFTAGKPKQRIFACIHCGAELQHVGMLPRFWIFAITMMVTVIVLQLFYHTMISHWGLHTASNIMGSSMWVLCLGLLFFAFTGMRFEKVGDSPPDKK
jgi:hypothetical protein